MTIKTTNYKDEVRELAKEIVEFIKINYPDQLIKKKAIISKWDVPFNRERMLWPILESEYNIEVQRDFIKVRKSA